MILVIVKTDNEPMPTFYSVGFNQVWLYLDGAILNDNSITPHEEKVWALQDNITPLLSINLALYSHVVSIQVLT